MTLTDAGCPEHGADEGRLELIETCARRLAVEFPERFLLTEVLSAVVEAHADLVGDEPASALPELVERLARYRLLAR